MSRTSPSRIQLRLFFTATPQEEHAHPSSRAFLTHPSPLHPLCHTHKEISDCTAFPLLPLGIHVLLIYTSKRCSQLLLNIPNSLAQTRRKCNWHTRHGALTWPRALVCFGVSSMIFFFFLGGAHQFQICRSYSPDKPHYEQGQKGDLSVTTRLNGIFKRYPQRQRKQFMRAHT